ncbi:MAG TPA: fibrobacter succinogenes major paralogous domain-containing protein [Ferruginibacter sp.]|nr:fibrobacter succinogenes major paralogous domain-containing protein [Ferruginibacter sp.]
MKVIFRLFFVLFFCKTGFSQNIGIGTSNPDSSAKLEIASTSQGFLLPRMNADKRDSIRNPAIGLMVYCLDCGINGELQVYNGIKWTNTGGGVAAPSTSVTIGTQVWSSKNLDVSVYRNGDPIPEVTDPSQWGTLTTGAWCYYLNDSGNGILYGKLYNWFAVNDPRGLAPQGWHIPTDAEWSTLINYLGSSTDAGGKLKATYLWNSPNTGATNSSGFTGLPAGARVSFGNFGSLGNFTYMWSATEADSFTVWCRALNYNSTLVPRAANDKLNGLSVRCIKN